METSEFFMMGIAVFFLAMLALIARAVLLSDLPPGGPVRRARKGGGGDQGAIERRLDELERRQADDIAGVRDEIREIRDSR